MIIRKRCQGRQGAIAFAREAERAAAIDFDYGETFQRVIPQAQQFRIITLGITFGTRHLAGRQRYTEVGFPTGQILTIEKWPPVRIHPHRHCSA